MLHVEEAIFKALTTHLESRISHDHYITVKVETKLKKYICLSEVQVMTWLPEKETQIHRFT